MGRGSDIFCYRNILAIDPGYSFKNGAGYAIFDHESLKLVACGIVKPFAQGVANQKALDEIADKIRKVWEENVGFSYDPKIICIEYPRVYPFQRINNDYLLHLACLAGMIRRDYKAPKTEVLRPRAFDWKQNKTKQETIDEVQKSLDCWSIKKLERSLSSVQKTLHHNIYDAVGLALWAIGKKNLKKN